MIYEAEFAAGLLPIVQEEIRACIGTNGHIIGSPRDDSVQFTFTGNHENLLQLRTIVAVYTLLQFEISRPKALLGHQHFHHILDTIRSFLDLGHYQSLYLNAAGSDSSVMQRIKSELCQHLGLASAEQEGDLLLRMRRTPRAAQSWDVLIRLTARPLATRAWRICNYEGALNASVAAAMLHLMQPTPQDRCLNIACGSGTILIECQHLMPNVLMIGCDISADALNCAKQNSGQTHSLKLIQTDAIQVPFASHSIDKLVADLPFGQLVGSHDENEWLYPAILHEAARVAKKKARFVVISHEVRLMEAVLNEMESWQMLEKPLKITLSGLDPRIYILERS